MGSYADQFDAVYDIWALTGLTNPQILHVFFEFAP